MSIKGDLKVRMNTHRNLIYLFYGLAGLSLFVPCEVVANSGVGNIEAHIFYFFNNMSNNLKWFFLTISILGTYITVVVLSLVSIILQRYKMGIHIFLAGTCAYIAQIYLKSLHIRLRPVYLLSDVQVRTSVSSKIGFPSGHSTVIWTIGFTLYAYVPTKYRKYITLVALLVCISRLYLGVHLPLDLVGGFAISVIIASLFNLFFKWFNSRSFKTNSLTLE